MHSFKKLCTDFENLNSKDFIAKHPDVFDVDVDLGKPCQLFGECSLVTNAGCVNSNCQCDNNYISNGTASSNKCVQDILLNEVCSKHSDCHQPGAGPSRMECVVGVCKCKSPYLEESGICLSSSTSVVFFKSVMLFLGTIFLIK
ncbi:hypothetical protein WA026_023385 [Henosepilachna vigintioctopunctata]|uniref:EB domain-containing protein n=1 Tax=Henosepilachna vigintioctopunctata TaxID=420089 RepID=A0AAW1V6R8_9CUCU